MPTIPGSRTGYTEFNVLQTVANLGTTDPTRAGERQFFVRVPADYDPSRALAAGSPTCGTATSAV